MESTVLTHTNADSWRQARRLGQLIDLDMTWILKEWDRESQREIHHWQALSVLRTSLPCLLEHLASELDRSEEEVTGSSGMGTRDLSCCFCDACIPEDLIAGLQLCRRLILKRWGQQVDRGDDLELALRLETHIDHVVLDAIRRSRATSDRAVKITRERIERLQAVTAALSEAVTPAQVADVVVENGVAAVGALKGALALVSADCTRFELGGAVGYSSATLSDWSSWPLSMRNLYQAVYDSRAPTFFHTIDAFLAVYPEFAGSKGIEGCIGMAGLPLQIEDRVLGVLSWCAAHSRKSVSGSTMRMVWLASIRGSYRMTNDE